MRRAEPGSIGRRLAQLRAPRSQREQAAALGVPERTYQTYEQDTRTPDLRTLSGLFLQGWNPSWVLFGVGEQRLGARDFIEWFANEKYPDASTEQAAAAVSAGYGTEFPVPLWVKEELPSLSQAEAREVLDGSWREHAASPSQRVSQQALTVAIQQVEAVVSDRQPPMPPAKKAELILAVAELIQDGMSEAKVLRFVRAAVG